MTDIFVGSSSNGNADGTSWVDRYGSIQAAIDDVVSAAATRIIIGADATHTIATELDLSGLDGLSLAETPVLFIGANSSGVIDGTRPTLQASAAISGNDIFDTGGGIGLTSIFMRDLILDANDQAATCLNIGDTSVNDSQFLRVDFINATTSCASFRQSGLVVVRCRFSGSGGGGIANPTNSGSGTYLFNVITDNVGDGIEFGGADSVLANNLIYGNGGYGINFDVKTNQVLQNNTIHDNDGGGIFFEGANADDGGFALINNVFSKNGGSGKYHVDLDATMALSGDAVIAEYNHLYDDGSMSGAVNNDLTPGIFSSDTNVTDMSTGDAGFTDTTAPGFDFTPTSSSPLKAAGVGVDTE